MHNVNNNNKHSIFASLILVLFLLAGSLGINYMVEGWPNMFTTPTYGYDYLFLFFTLLWLFLLPCRSRVIKWSIKKEVIIGIIAGQVISMIALVGAEQFFISNPIDRWINTIDKIGLFTTLSASFVVTAARSFALFGWLFGLIAILCLPVYIPELADD